MNKNSIYTEDDFAMRELAKRRSACFESLNAEANRIKENEMPPDKVSDEFAKKAWARFQELKSIIKEGV